MRILLIAHEFPPIPSAQSLRWAYLVRELALQGHQVDVLAPDHPGYGPLRGYPKWPCTVTVHRTFPGPFAWLLKHRPSRSPVTDDSATEPVSPRSRQASVAVRLNWKGRLLGSVSRLYGFWMFPDLRSEWSPWARRALDPLLETVNPDVVIASHEPASTLPLGLRAKRRGYRLVADLGDPVCASYTPGRWRRRALRLERQVCREADLVTVTTAMTRELLIARHGGDGTRIHVMEQGFDASPNWNEDCALAAPMDAERLELLYTGSFYSFRRPDQLVDAVVRIPEARLTVASSTVPQTLVDAAARYPEAIRLLGFLRHDDVLRMQRNADLLVNLANDDPTQVPGKIYEYLGASRPILHIGDDLNDEAAALLRRTGAGLACRDEGNAIAETLAERVRDRGGNGFSCGRRRDEEAVSRYAWTTHAQELVKQILALGNVTVKST